MFKHFDLIPGMQGSAADAARMGPKSPCPKPSVFEEAFPLKSRSKSQPRARFTAKSGRYSVVSSEVVVGLHR